MTCPDYPIPVELRHMSSSPTIRSPNRASQHLRVGVGARTTNSIPSSPTSVHSSSSAIFERDIEPIVPPSPPSAFHHHVNPHRIPRAKGTETIEQSVPSVLDSAAAILGALDAPASPDDSTIENVSVVAPTSSSIAAAFDTLSVTMSDVGSGGRTTASGFASPIGSLRSRSPSPLGSRAAATAGSVLLGIPSPTTSLPPSVLGLHGMTRAQNSTESSSSTLTQAPNVETETDHQLPSPSLSPLASPSSHLSSHPPSPIHSAKKRLSFMSYSDLLSSTPAGVQPLSSLTTGASGAEPPPHIPSISGLNLASAIHAQAQAYTSSYSPSLRSQMQLNPASSGASNPSSSAAPSLRNFSLMPLPPFAGAAVGPSGGLTHPGKRDSIAMLDNVGGEWEREGLGRGLEERLEALENVKC